MPGQELVCQHAQRVDVRSMINVGVGRCLLRRHVGRGAKCHTHGRQVVTAGGVAHRLGDPEVGDQRVSAGEHHVVRLDVAVDQAVLVGVAQGIGDVVQQSRHVRMGSSASRCSLSRSDLRPVRHDVEKKAIGFP